MAAKPKAAFIVGILAIAIAIVASVSLYNYLKSQEEEVKRAVATDKIVVASEEIGIGSAINATQVKTAEWPRANLPQGSFTSSDNVVGRRVLSKYQPGDPIVEAKLVPKEGAPGVLIYKIPEGHRAMTVGVDQVAGVAGFITPGNMVDVILTIEPFGARQPVSKIVLQNVPVLAIGQIVEQQEDGKPQVVPTVTMDVTPEDAEKLAIASTQGRLQLVLRPAGDTQVAQTVGATVTKVMSGVSTAAPRKTTGKSGRAVKTVAKETKKPEILTVEIWRNGKMETKTFSVEKM